MGDNYNSFSSNTQPKTSFNMMKLVLAISLLVTLSMAAPMDDGTDVHNTLIADYCAADDAGRDAILVQLEGWCLPTSKMDDKTRAFCNEANTSYEEVGADKAVFRQGLADGVC